MLSALIGHTGFLGGNLARQHCFDECYNSQNISAIGGRKFDLLVCSGVTALKYWANQHPAEDRARIDSLLGHLASVSARRVIVLSTVDVYPVTSSVDESFDCHSLPNHSYGANRLYFEDSIRRLFDPVTIVRISGVFGPGLKKNVIYDLLHDNCLDNVNPESRFQYYNADRLWTDIAGLDRQLINFVSAPVRTSDIIERFFPGKVFPGKAVGGRGPLAQYDIRTRYGGPDGYLFSAHETLVQLGEFITSCRETVAT